jgi:hypothetical protein
MDEDARSWYLGLSIGFAPVLDDPNRLYVPMAYIRQFALEPIGPEL